MDAVLGRVLQHAHALPTEMCQLEAGKFDPGGVLVLRITRKFINVGDVDRALGFVRQALHRRILFEGAAIVLAGKEIYRSIGDGNAEYDPTVRKLFDALSPYARIERLEFLKIFCNDDLVQRFFKRNEAVPDWYSPIEYFAERAIPLEGDSEYVQQFNCRSLTLHLDDLRQRDWSHAGFNLMASLVLQHPKFERSRVDVLVRDILGNRAAEGIREGDFILGMGEVVSRMPFANALRIMAHPRLSRYERNDIMMRHKSWTAWWCRRLLGKAGLRDV